MPAGQSEGCAPATRGAVGRAEPGAVRALVWHWQHGALPGQAVPAAPARTDQQTALLHLCLLPAFVLEVSAVDCWSFYCSGYSEVLQVSHGWVQRQRTRTLLLHQTYAFPWNEGKLSSAAARVRVLDWCGSFCLCPGEGNPAPREQADYPALPGVPGGCGVVSASPETQTAALGLLLGSNGTRPASWESRASVLVPLWCLVSCSCAASSRVRVSQGPVQVWGLGNQGRVPALPFWPPGASVSLTTLRCSRICMCLHPHEDNSAHSFLICWEPCICTGTGIDSFSDLGRPVSSSCFPPPLFFPPLFTLNLFSRLRNLSTALNLGSGICLQPLGHFGWQLDANNGAGGLEQPRQWGWLHAP